MGAYRHILSTATLVALTTAPAFSEGIQEKLSKNDRVLASMGAEEASIHMHVEGLGDLDPIIWVSSEPFNRTKPGDKFLRAGIRKSDGSIFYQLYMKTASARGPVRLSRLTYIVDGTLRTIDINKLNTDVDCGRYGCVYFEDAVADVARVDLDELAKSEPSDLEWRMKMFADTGGEETSIFKSEIAGFLHAVDQQVARVKGK